MHWSSICSPTSQGYEAVRTGQKAQRLALSYWQLLLFTRVRGDEGLNISRNRDIELEDYPE